MKIKSYFSNSVEQAIQDARREMGTGAMLLTSRRSSPDTRSLGAYEVVFGLPEQAESAAPPAIHASTLSVELDSLRSQLDELKSALKFGSARPGASASSPGDALYQELLSADVESGWSRQISEEAFAALPCEPPAQPPLTSAVRLRQLAVQSISNRLRFAFSDSAEPRDPARVVVFAGPSGGGKTASLVKFAVQRCLAVRRSVRIISFDAHRAACHEKLRCLAGIIGAGFIAVDTLAGLQAALQESPQKNVALVDTPGYDRGDSLSDIGRCLEMFHTREVHLVLPASMKRLDMCHSIQQYEPIQPDYLLFTKLDETASPGAALSAALESGKPLSFFGKGQGIPEDLEPAHSAALTSFLTSCEPVEAVSAA